MRPAGPGLYAIGIAGARATVPGGTAPGADPPGTAGPARHAVLVRPDWARLAGPGGPADPDGRGDLPGVIADVRFRGPHTDYHLSTPAGTLLIREAGPPQAGCGPVRWRLLRARLMPRDQPPAQPGPARG